MARLEVDVRKDDVVLIRNVIRALTPCCANISALVKHRG